MPVARRRREKITINDGFSKEKNSLQSAAGAKNLQLTMPPAPLESAPRAIAECHINAYISCRFGYPVNFHYDTGSIVNTMLHKQFIYTHLRFDNQSQNQ